MYPIVALPAQSALTAYRIALKVFALLQEHAIAILCARGPVHL
ncbi:hypothetical protein ACQ4M4_13750 [Leptolyngbya sp. AN02str]